VKKCLLSLAVSLFVATLSTPLAKADDPGPICGSNGCQKPGVRMLMPTTADDPGPICGSNGCQKPGVRMLMPGTADDPGPICGSNGCQKPGQ